MTLICHIKDFLKDFYLYTMRKSEQCELRELQMNMKDVCALTQNMWEYVEFMLLLFYDVSLFEKCHDYFLVDFRY